MLKFYKAATVAAMLGTIGLLGVGTASAGDYGQDFGKYEVSQSTKCGSHDLNVDVLGEVGVLNGVLGNGLGGEGSPGAQSSKLGSQMGCSNSAF
jgi:hypothetical protein|nr:hypothetical protein OH826_33060 [Streptomyces sp. NBC_00899]